MPDNCKGTRRGETEINIPVKSVYIKKKKIKINSLCIHETIAINDDNNNNNNVKRKI